MVDQCNWSGRGAKVTTPGVGRGEFGVLRMGGLPRLGGYADGIPVARTAGFRYR